MKLLTFNIKMSKEGEDNEPDQPDCNFNTCIQRLTIWNPKPAYGDVVTTSSNSPGSGSAVRPPRQTSASAAAVQEESRCGGSGSSQDCAASRCQTSHQGCD